MAIKILMKHLFHCIIALECRKANYVLKVVHLLPVDAKILHFRLINYLRNSAEK